MHRVKNCLYVFLLFCCFSSCNNKAVDFNNGLVNIQKSVLEEVRSFKGKIQKVNVDSLPLTNIKTEAERIALFINNKINEAKNLSALKEGENLKDAILKQLQFEKNIVEKIGRLAEPDISKEEKMQIETEFLNSQNKANELEANVHAAQEAFAKQYKFKLENK